MAENARALADGTNRIARSDDLAHILGHLVGAQCCSVVGVSNIGKSTIMRAASRADVWSDFVPDHVDRYVPIYVDLNSMLEVTERGLYELILRTIRTTAIDDADALRSRIDNAYAQLVSSPQDSLTGRVSFEQALTAFVEGLEKHLILLFDEFDEPFRSLDAQVFLNLRALRDRYEDRITYVTATGRRLTAIRSGRGVGEFCELFAHHVHYLQPLPNHDSASLVEEFMLRWDISFTQPQVELVSEATGGHPGLLHAACHSIARVMRTPKWPLERPRFHEERLTEAMESDPGIRTECAKLWDDLTEAEQDTLISLLSGNPARSQEALSSLRRKYLVRQQETGPEPFCGLFAHFVKGQRLARFPGPRGVRVDVEAGDVYVNGAPIPPLTDLEYRLLLLLYGRANRICDKYSIVESVWGDEYMDEVDDARIEKLVSRLRAKIEPNPSQPRHVLTVRGRGYRLVSQ